MQSRISNGKDLKNKKKNSIILLNIYLKNKNNVIYNINSINIIINI